MATFGFEASISAGVEISAGLSVGIGAGADDPTAPPFTAFNFRVEIHVPGLPDPLCNAGFSECDGLEMSMEVKTIREGGNNGRPIHLLGQASYGQLSLKRGMTSSIDLWSWFEQNLSRTKDWHKATVTVVMMASDRSSEQVRFELTGCRPVRMRAPGLNAKDGFLAIEELSIAYETMTIRRP